MADLGNKQRWRKVASNMTSALTLITPRFAQTLGFQRKSATLQAALVGLSLALAGCSARSETPAQQTSPQSAPVIPIRAAPALADRLPGSIADTVERALPSVVSITTSSTTRARPQAWFFGKAPGPQTRQGLGSGVILSAEGLVVTNNHVVEGADKVSVRLHDGREYEADVVGTDPKSDLAVLQLQGSADDLKPIQIGDSAALRLGEVVLAVGNPFGVGQTVTMGIVSAKGRADVGIAAYEDFIQTGAAINPGNSGGALVNSAGQLVGINTAILSRSGGNVGIGFAIPTNMASPIIQALREEGHVSRGFLGVTIQELDEDLRLALKVEAAHGILLADVSTGGPADVAGLEAGDVVIAVNGAEMTSLGHFRNAIAAAGADKKVKLSIVRAGESKEIATRLGQFPDETRIVEAVTEAEQQKQTKWGLVLRELDAKMRGRLRLDANVKGALIVRIDPSSPAARARLVPGDIVVAIDQQPVTDSASLVKVLLGNNEQHLVQILRRGSRRYIVLKP